MKQLYKGFTLAELLIALTILGVIAVFTIPKILSAQQNQKDNAQAKEAIATVSAAYQQYKIANQVDANFSISSLTPYLNYVAVDTSSSLDEWYTQGNHNCNFASGVCLKLHNGALFQYWPADHFSGTNTTNAVPFIIDPDGGVTDGTTNGPGKSLLVFLYYDGKIRDVGNLEASTTYSAGVWNRDSGLVPPWFSWN